MYEELVKRLRERAAWLDFPYFDAENPSEEAMLMKQAAEAIEDLQKRVPKTPHGRLIDADDFERDLQFEWEQNEISNGEWVNLREYLRDAPTIIPASEEGE